MSENEKEPFVELAKQHKYNKKFKTGLGDSKMDCTRQLISVNILLHINNYVKLGHEQ